MKNHARSNNHIHNNIINVIPVVDGVLCAKKEGRRRCLKNEGGGEGRRRRRKEIFSLLLIWFPLL